MKKNKTLLQMEIGQIRDALHSEEGERQFYNESEGFTGEFDNSKVIDFPTQLSPK